MNQHGCTSLATFLDDRVIYRNLDVQDPSLPSFHQLAATLSLPANRIPRTGEPAHALVVAELLKHAQELDHPGKALQNLVFVGNSQGNNSKTFANICQAGNWHGIAFLSNENTDFEPDIKSKYQQGLPIYRTNRWFLLEFFEAFCNQHAIHINEQTTVVLNLDKTCLGAFGRNDQAIDHARALAAVGTASSTLGTAIDVAKVIQAYQRFNLVDFYDFTGDNPDILAYLCLLVSAGVIEPETLVAQVRLGEWTSFQAYVEDIQTRFNSLPVSIQPTHTEFFASLQNGAPLTFKAFRLLEYQLTSHFVQSAPDIVPDADTLSKILVITEEVRKFGLDCKTKGALLFGLSDTPDEAALPTPELAQKGYLPLHRAEMLSVSSEKK
ncbi:MAG: hypothetical protein CVU39_27265 [Chloroflexi bacterium HGW-Chloroflexi-10]|nr:MAG: hypothetical protein CVU39_27265 [Chloroflexi bacterium HGW-Chloroflexi-10]